MSGRRKTLLTALAVIFLALGLHRLLADAPNGQRPNQIRERSDIAAYWTAGLLFDRGANPYSVTAAARLEGVPPAQAWRALVMRNAPWTLPLVTPLGALSYASAFYVWDFVSIAAVLFAFALLAWRYRLAPPRGFLPLLFVPAYMFAIVAQTGWLVLLGLALFLSYDDRNPWAAGAGLFLATIKFNICFLFWPVLLLWVIDRRKWRLFGTLAALWTTAMAVVLARDHAVVRQYLASFAGTRLSTQVFPNLMGWIRAWAGSAWPDFVFPAAGVVWALVYYRRHRTAWSWTEQLPLLLLVSLVLAPYSFLFDELIATVAVFAAAASARGTAWPRQAGLLAGFLGAQGLLLYLLTRGPTDHTFAYAWTPLTWLVLYLLATQGRPAAVQSGRNLNAAESTD